MSRRRVVRGGLLACTMLFLVWLAWKALSGGFNQAARSRTAGQKVQTATQIEAGLLSLLVMLTCFWRRRWAQPVRVLWSVTLAAAAGISSLVWGPSMPLLGLLFAGIALLVSRAVIWSLRTALGE